MASLKLTWTAIPDGSTSIVQVTATIEETVDAAVAETFARELALQVAQMLGSDAERLRADILREMLEGPQRR